MPIAAFTDGPRGMLAMAPDAIGVKAFYAPLDLDGIARMHNADSQTLVAQIDLPVAH
ncbi:hypothetical protein [Xanthomonas graminis]|nr:hypothetical protein [Xanthomonas translucens]UKE76779.1 hypothetical protein KM317_15135 [Xanthomonas translucens pv. arrhenatheri]